MMIQNQYNGKIGLFKLIFWLLTFQKPSTLLCRWFLEGETEILV